MKPSQNREYPISFSISIVTLQLFLKLKLSESEFDRAKLGGRSKKIIIPCADTMNQAASGNKSVFWIIYFLDIIDEW
jgi:glutaredoxin-related protein